MRDSKSIQTLPTAYSYYYLEENWVKGLLSQISRLPAKERTEAITLKEIRSIGSSEETAEELSVGVKDVRFQNSEKRKMENQNSQDAGLSITSTYDQTETTSSLASLLELLLDKEFLVEDFNRRVIEVIHNWQGEVKRFADIATDRYKFQGIAPLLEAADDHTQTLILLHLSDFWERRMTESTSKLVKVKVRRFAWCSRPEGDNHFRFKGNVEIPSKFGNHGNSLNICSITGVGNLNFLSDEAMELVKDEGIVESAEILAKFQSWSQQVNEMIVVPILIR